MGKEWDRLGDIGKASHQGFDDEPGRWMQEWHERWAHEALRVLKPGGHLLAFGGTRTFHRLTCALEDMGFEIRDCLMWLYGQGFPKSLDVSKAIDKAAGVERQVIGKRHDGVGNTDASIHRHGGLAASRESTYALTTPTTPQARQWQGWGTALKPAWEAIIVARKPLDGTVAQNVLRHGTGALNIDGCRIGFCCEADERSSKTRNRHADFRSKARKNRIYGRDERSRGNYDAPGRWPTNVTLSHTEGCRQVGHTRVPSNGHHPAARGAGGLGTAGHRGQQGLTERSSAGELAGCWECSPDCAVRMLDQHSRDAGKDPRRDSREHHAEQRRGDYLSGFGASRFFYCAKASRSERDAGLGGFDETATTDDGREKPIDNPYLPGKTLRQNIHPTVKPITLMRYLVRLVTPPGSIVLDPFAGSGSTGVAAVIEGARFLGIEREADYVEIARARIRHWARRAGEMDL
jgi:DNA methylase